MSHPVIQVENLSKRFFIAARQVSYETLSDIIGGIITNPLKRASQLLRGHAYAASNLTETIWALKDISFMVEHGEVMGIIGHNGAGKSTLLKILSRITEPTEGYAKVYGRVGSLLEVGTGFHQELTGRENIYLNASILGMKRAEINRKFDEIVEFSGVEKFLDTPVKHLSTGMQLRLGFAVAAHLETEILIVDEVLAVGDAEFQKKCLGKMSDVAQSGRTVLFVSHNLSAVQSLCTRAILLKNGSVEMIGNTPDVLNHYQAYYTAAVNLSLEDRTDRDGNGLLRFTKLRVSRPAAQSETTLAGGEDAIIHFYFKTKNGQSLRNVRFVFSFLDIYGNRLFSCDTLYKKSDFLLISPEGEVQCRIARLPLASGSYFISIEAHIDHSILDHIPNAAKVEVVDGDFYGTGVLPSGHSAGWFLIDNEWQIIQ
jgi:lipopolysaccharide transport system ATP-binding protein